MRKFILLLVTILVSSSSFSQKVNDPTPSATQTIAPHKLEINKEGSHFKILGTSSIHDWEMISNFFTGSLVFTDMSSTDLGIESIDVKVKVKSLVSGKKIMDRKCYDALKNDEHPTIIYRFKKVESFEAVSDKEYKAKLSGTLMIAGKTNPVSINVKIRADNGKVTISGEKPLKMSDFDVVPPTALLGTLKTGNDITIDFNLNYL
jgi:polyisoprenoid-binding protein YceI